MGFDPHGGDSGPGVTYFRPRESERGIYTEKKLGDESLVIWESALLPDDAVVTHVTLIPYRGEKAVVAWQAGAMRLPEGNPLPGESVDAAVKRIALEQAGIMDPTYVQLGHFRARATSQHKTLAPDTITYLALFGVESGGFADFPSDPAFERRVILQRDLNTLLRSSYVEVRREYTDALDHWLLERLKANLRED